MLLTSLTTVRAVRPVTAAFYRPDCNYSVRNSSLSLYTGIVLFVQFVYGHDSVMHVQPVASRYTD